MNNLSERVQREFETWKEKYEIPEHMEFEVKTLLKLQEEYDQVEVGSNTTKTRESLLGMINRLHMNMRLKEKVVVNKPMYIEYIHTSGKQEDKILIYVEDQLIALDSRKYKELLSIQNYASIIHNIAVVKESEIYIDVRGFGMSIYDCLKEFKDLKVNKLDISKAY